MTSQYALSPAKKMAAVLTLALGGLGASFNASAHIPPEHESLLAEYEDYIMLMRTPNGNSRCCSDRDAYINLPEELQEDGSVIVTLDTDNNGEKLDEPIKVRIPPENILSGKQAAEFCEAETAKGSTTCKAPPYSISWIVYYKAWGKNTKPSVYCHSPRPLMLGM